MRTSIFVVSGLLLGGCLDSYNNTPKDPERSVLGVLCTTELTISGAFQLETERPMDTCAEGACDPLSCWEVGLWTFKATPVAGGTCQTPLKMAAEYQFRVTYDAASESKAYSYVTDPAHPFARIKVTSGGGGLCEGALTIIDPTDGKTVVNLKPALQLGNALDGSGEYEVYGNDQRTAEGAD